MDLDSINKSLREKEEWEIRCLTLDLYEKPGLHPSSHLPTQHDLVNFLPNDIDPYYHQGGGVDVSLFKHLFVSTNSDSHQYLTIHIMFLFTLITSNDMTCSRRKMIGYGFHHGLLMHHQSVKKSTISLALKLDMSLYVTPRKRAGNLSRLHYVVSAINDPDSRRGPKIRQKVPSHKIMRNPPVTCILISFKIWMLNNFISAEMVVIVFTTQDIVHCRRS